MERNTLLGQRPETTCIPSSLPTTSQTLLLCGFVAEQVGRGQSYLKIEHYTEELVRDAWGSSRAWWYQFSSWRGQLCESRARAQGAAVVRISVESGMFRGLMERSCCRRHPDHSSIILWADVLAVLARGELADL